MTAQKAKTTAQKQNVRKTQKQKQSVGSARPRVGNPTSQVKQSSAQRVRDFMGGDPGRRALAQATALDQFVLGLYAPEVISRGPCLRPQNTFVTHHRVNTTFSNTLNGTTFGSSIALVVGPFWEGQMASASTPGPQSWEPAAVKRQVAVMANISSNPCYIGIPSNSNTAATYTSPFNASAAAVNTTAAYDCFFPLAVWDSGPVLYAAGTVGDLNPNPRRCVGLKVSLECTSSPLNIQGSIRGGDNGSLALSARSEAVATTNADATIDPSVVSDVFDVPWTDAYGGYTTFNNDPRIPELGPLERGKRYEFVWVPTDESMIQYEDEPTGGMWLQSWPGAPTFAGTSFGSSALPVNIIRRGPCVIIYLSGLSTTTAQSFRVRATMAYEHAVTPSGLGYLYDYSSKAPWFILPWDKMAALPVASQGTGTLLLRAAHTAD